MGLIGKNNNLVNLQKEAGTVLSVFQSTINKLSTIIDRAREQEELKREEAQAAINEAEGLKSLCEDNESVIKNINNLINK